MKNIKEQKLKSEYNGEGIFLIKYEGIENSEFQSGEVKKDIYF